MNLICFTCSTTNPQKMFSAKPEEYVSLDPKGNNLKADLPLLKKFLEKLNKLKIPYNLNIIIGNTDPYYIYTLSGRTCPFYTKAQFFKKFNFRWKKYKQNFTSWINKKLQNKNVKVISWYEFEKKVEEKTGVSFEKLFNKYLKDINKYFRSDKFDWELNKMKENFGTGKYFGNLSMPSEKNLKQWVKRKFTEYMLQGLWLKENFPNGILLQNEKPTMLRYEMYQPLIKEKYKTELPNLFIFGIYNSGYV